MDGINDSTSGAEFPGEFNRQNAISVPEVRDTIVLDDRHIEERCLRAARVSKTAQTGTVKLTRILRDHPSMSDVRRSSAGAGHVVPQVPALPAEPDLSYLE